MEKIKISVSYEQPKTTKFDALLKAYEISKKQADEIISYYKPLADAAEEAKFNAIMEQLETIKEYAHKLSILKNGAVIWITARIANSICDSSDNEGEMFQVQYRPKDSKQWKFCTKYREFSREHINYHTTGCHNFIGKWDEWEVFKKLETAAYDQLQELIEYQEEKGQKEINRLNNIVK